MRLLLAHSHLVVALTLQVVRGPVRVVLERLPWTLHRGCLWGQVSLNARGVAARDHARARVATALVFVVRRSRLCVV